MEGENRMAKPSGSPCRRPDERGPAWFSRMEVVAGSAAISRRLRTTAYERTALSVMASPSSMTASPSSSCASVMVKGGFVKNVLNRTNV
jgi:hypothetical protein